MSDSEPESVSFFPQQSRTRWILLLSLFVLSFAFRTFDALTDSYYGFDTRQYHSAVISKGYYYEQLDPAPAHQQVAIINRERQPHVEPRFMEQLTASVASLIGNNALWVSGIISSIFWMIGGFFIYRIMADAHSGDAAIVSLAVYLFMPFGIITGNNFQPDPLMLMGVIITAYLLRQHVKAPTTRSIMMVSVVAAITILVKLQAAFLIAPLFLMMQVSRWGWQKAFLNRDNIIFAVIALTPTVLWLVDGLFISGYFKDNASGRLIPELVFMPQFWRGWLRLISENIGFVFFIGGLLGVLATRHKHHRYMLIGLWGGYCFLGISFTWNIHTHNYYHLPLVPIVALSVGEIGALIFSYLRQVNTSLFARGLVYGVLVLSIGLSFLLVLADNDTSDAPLNYDAYVATAIEIGEEIDHSTEVFFIAQSYGLPLTYHGDISGEPWLNQDENDFLSIVGTESSLDSAESIGEYIANSKLVTSPEFFVITDMADWSFQVELQTYLDDNYPIYRQTDDYIIYDLRTEKPADS